MKNLTLSREQLYHLVWSLPLTVLGKHIGISDVAIAKHCRKIEVPVPPRGYWAKLQAGKPDDRTPLPPRDLGTIGSVAMNGNLTPELQVILDQCPRKQNESIEILADRFKQRLGRIVVRALSNGVHPSIQKLLKKDEGFRRRRATEQWFWNNPKYDSPIQKRRLRILNALLMGFARTGSLYWDQIERDQVQNIRGGDLVFQFKLEEAHSRNKGREVSTEKAAVLKLEMGTGVYSEFSKSWQDDAAGTLEEKLSELALGMMVATARLKEKWHQEHLAAEEERKEKETRERVKKQEEARRKREAELEAHRQSQISGLLDEAENHRKSMLIRSYVEDVETHQIGDLSKRREWVTWALDIAKQLDPFTSGRAETAINAFDTEQPSDNTLEVGHGSK
jgi:hypothetical protein